MLPCMLQWQDWLLCAGRRAATGGANVCCGRWAAALPCHLLRITSPCCHLLHFALQPTPSAALRRRGSGAAKGTTRFLELSGHQTSWLRLICKPASRARCPGARSRPAPSQGGPSRTCGRLHSRRHAVALHSALSMQQAAKLSGRPAGDGWRQQAAAARPAAAAARRMAAIPTTSRCGLAGFLQEQIEQRKQSWLSLTPGEKLWVQQFADATAQVPTTQAAVEQQRSKLQYLDEAWERGTPSSQFRCAWALLTPQQREWMLTKYGVARAKDLVETAGACLAAVPGHGDLDAFVWQQPEYEQRVLMAARNLRLQGISFRLGSTPLLVVGVISCAGIAAVARPMAPARRWLDGQPAGCSDGRGSRAGISHGLDGLAVLEQPA